MDSSPINSAFAPENVAPMKFTIIPTVSVSAFKVWAESVEFAQFVLQDPNPLLMAHHAICAAPTKNSSVANASANLDMLTIVLKSAQLAVSFLMDLLSTDTAQFAPGT